MKNSSITDKVPSTCRTRLPASKESGAKKRRAVEAELDAVDTPKTPVKEPTHPARNRPASPEELRRQLLAAEQQNKRSLATIQKLRNAEASVNTDLSTKLCDSQRYTTVLQTHARDLQAAVEQAKAERDQAKAECDQAKAERDQAKAECGQAKTECGQVKAERDQAKAERDASLARLRALRDKHWHLSQQYQLLGRTLNQIAPLRQELAQTNAGLDMAQARVRDLEGENGELTLARNHYVASTRDLMAENDRLKMELSQARADAAFGAEIQAQFMAAAEFLGIGARR